MEAKPINADLFAKDESGAVNQIKGLFQHAKAKEEHDFGIATDGLRWIFINKEGEVTDDFSISKDFQQIKVLLTGKQPIAKISEEEITEKFYSWYNALLHGGRYKDHKGIIRHISEKDSFVENIRSVERVEDREQIAQIIMDRLIFIKFLQSKGIIKTDVLRYISEYPEDTLVPKLRQLFFAVLNTGEEERLDLDKQFEGIPYLNGSLFNLTEIERKNTEFRMKAEILKDVINFLDSFKFVHREKEDADSINPEILGYIFERAMTALDRKGTGSYYTPKVITRYIAENTIYPCIIERVNKLLKAEKGYRDTEFIKTIEELFILPATTLNGIWNKIVLNLKVLDNACGSGAFLLQAANILFDLNRRINDKLSTGNSDVALKKLILIKNIYGVDINPNAIEIAKLRLWLWLADSYDAEHIEALPNIDYNLRVGNSLVGYLDLSKFKTYKVSLMDYLSTEKPLFELLSERMDLLGKYKYSYGKESKDLRERLLEKDEKIRRVLNINLYREFLEKKIKITEVEFENLNPFHWGFEFYGVFDTEKPEEERGFDVVIGNPPYVSAWEMEKSNKITRDILPLFYSDKCELKSHWDLYIPFILQATNTAKSGGYFSYILPNPICREKYATEIRRHILENTKITHLLTAGERNLFVGVSRQSVVFVLKLVPSVDQENEIEIQFVDEKDAIKTINKIQQKVWLGLHQSQFRYECDSTTLEIIDKMNKTGVRLGNVYYVNYGAQVSSKKKGEFGKSYLLTKEPKGNPKKFFEGKDLSRFRIRYRGLKLDYIPQIMYGPRVPELFELPKLIVRHISGNNDTLISTVDYSGYYCDHGLILATDYKNIKSEDRTKFKGYAIIEDHNYTPEFILGVLNSRLMSFFYRKVYATGSLQGSYSHVYPKHVRDFPLPNFKEIDEKAIDVVSIFTNYLLFLNATEERRIQLKETIEYFDSQIVDSLVYEHYFKEKFHEDGLYTEPIEYLLELVSKHLKLIDYDHWAELYYKKQLEEKLTSKENRELETLEKENLKIVGQVYNFLVNTNHIQKQIEKIKSHIGVKIIEQEVSRNA
jgi:hypothetical protein